MLFSLILENEAGDQIDMTATANQYMTSRVEGLKSSHRHNQHLQLCGYGRQLPQQRLHRKAKCRHFL